MVKLSLYIHSCAFPSLHPHREPCVFGCISHEDAIAQLMKPFNDHGAFLVREEMTSTDQFLYIRDGDTVQQYTIVEDDYQSLALAINDQKTYFDLNELVEHFSQNAEQLCTRLKAPSPYTNGWLIEGHQIKLQEKLAEDKSVEVWKGLWSNKQVAVKTLKPNTMPKHVFLREFHVLKTLQHPNIVSLYGVFSTDDSASIVTELLNHGNLVQYYRKGGSLLVMSDIISLIKQVINGMTYLQEHGTVHLNFGAKKVLLADNLCCKVSDFSMAKKLPVDSGCELEREGFSVKWSAPEVCFNRTVHINSDVWSFGIFLYELLTYCQSPYPGMSDTEVLEKIKTGYRMGCPPNCPDKFHNLMMECWVEKPEERPNFAALGETVESLSTLEGLTRTPMPPLPRRLHAPPPPLPRMGPPLPRPQPPKIPVMPGGRMEPPSPHTTRDKLPPVPKLPDRQPQSPKTVKDNKKRNWEVQRSEIKCVKKFSEDRFDVIWEGTWKENTNVSIRIPKEGILSKTEILEQIEVMKRVHHPNVIKLYGISTKQTPIYILTDLMKPGSLLQYLQDNKQLLEYNDLVKICVQVARGMAHLHKHHIIHRDIAARSVLVDEKLICKVSALNLAKVVDTNPHIYNGPTNEKVPIKWSAPEVITSHIFSVKSDVWSFGIFLYEVFVKFPYPGMTNREVLDCVPEGYRLPRPEDCPVDVHNIMLECWSEEPDARPNSVIIPQKLRDILQHDGNSSSESEEPLYEYLPNPGIVEEKAWDIEFTDFTLDSKLDNGKPGEIWKGTLKGETAVAIKCFNVESMSPEVAYKIELMKELEHPHVLQLYGVCTTKECVYVISELMKHGNLVDYLRGEGNSLGVETLVHFAADCGNGMAYLEEKGIIHGDLIGRSILIGDDLRCKLAKIGVGKTAEVIPHRKKLPVRWIPPEVALHDKFSVKSDVWSFGIVLSEIMTYGRLPYPGMRNAEVVTKVCAGYRMQRPPNCPKVVYQIMLDCWKEEPDIRPSFVAITKRLEELYSTSPSEGEETTWEIERSEVSFERLLKGKQAQKIWKGTLRKTPVAIKCLVGGTIKIELAKVELMKKLKHKHILQLCAMCTTKEPAYIITEFMEHGNLQDYLRGSGKRLKIEKLVTMSAECGSGMAYLGEHDIIHGKLTARNILVAENLTCKITGICGGGIESEDPYDGHIFFHIPFKWMAPETALYNHFSKQSDIWSFGIVLYEIMTHGQFPYPGMSNAEVVEKVREGYRMKCPPDCPQIVHDIMLECWKEEPEMRPSFEDVTRRLEEVFAYDEVEEGVEDQWEIEQSEVQLDHEIAQGQNGVVWKGMLGTIPVAIKCLVDNVSTELAKVELMKKLKHSHVLQLCAVCTARPVYIITEFMEHGNLWDYLRGSGKSLNIEKLVSMSAECASGMAYLGEHDIVHGNLTARCILVAEDLTCKVAGMCGGGIESEDPYEGQITFHIPIKWMAPETAIYNLFSKQSDVWSFGIVLYEIMTYGRAPYPGMSNAEVLEKIQKSYRMECPTNCPKDVYNLMLECWKGEPNVRPSFDDVTRRLEEVSVYIDVEPFNEEKESWEIEGEFVLNVKLAEGETGDIWQGLLQKTTTVAVKCLTGDTVAAELANIELVKKLKHPHLLHVYGVCTKKEPIRIVMELMKLGNLQDYLAWEGSSLEVDKLVQMAGQCASGMAYLSEHDIIHGNLTARSILVAEDLTCKVTGIRGGGIESEDPYEGHITFHIPIKWMAPETALYNHFSKQSDIWSFGIVLYEIMTYGEVPYPGMSNPEVLGKIQKGYRMECPTNCPQDVYNLMLECWKEEPQMRPSFETVTQQLNSEDEKKWEIERSQVSFERRLAQGETGEIWQGLLKGVPVAIKCLKARMTEEFTHKIDTMKRLQHPNILKLYGLCTTDEPILVITELVPLGNLLEYLHGDGRSHTTEQLMLIAMQINSGMIYLEEECITHGELTTRNILIGENLTCKITGIYGGDSAADEDPYSGYKTYHVPIKWLAPEAALYNRYSSKSDIWSYGIVLYEIFTYGRMPYPGMTNAEVLENLMKGYRMGCPPHCPQALHSLMQLCWKEDPNTRCDFSEVKQRLQQCFDDYFSEMKTEPDQIVLESKLGAGQSSEMWRGTWKNAKVAIKFLKPGTSPTDVFLWEADVLRTLQHPNIIRLLGICTKGEKMFFLTEFMEHGNLLEYLRGDGHSLKVPALMAMAAQVASGMVYLEAQNIIHRDVAARNVMVGDELTCKVSDFSRAQMIGGRRISAIDEAKMALKWTAPEALSHQKFSTKSDVWSFGILLFEMVTYGRVPYPGMTNAEVKRKVEEGYRMPCPPNSPQVLHSIMLQCWAEKPENRPSFEMLQEQVQTFISEDKKWEIDPNQIVLKQKVGEGRFGEVWEGVWNNVQVAVKNRKLEGTMPDEFLWEAETMKTLQHSNVIKLLAVCTKGEKVFMVTEFMSQGTLLEYLRHAGRSLKVQTLVAMAAQVASGMAYIQTQNIIHRDLAARSILVGDDLICKVSDFSEAIVHGVRIRPAQEARKVAMKWTAPEAAVHNKFSMKSDIWSFGIMMYEMVTYGRFPYPAMTNEEVLTKVQAGYRMPCPRDCPSELYKIIKECWSDNPDSRPQFESMENTLQSFIDGIDEWEIEESEITFSHKVGMGRFGEVWEGQWNNVQVALKCLKTEGTTCRPDVFLWEAEILKKIQHPNVVKLLAVCTKGQKVFMVTEFLKNGTLLEYLKRVGQSLKVATLMTMAAQIASGMAYIQTQNIIHRDLAARSILVGDNLVCKVSDFGEAIISGKDNPEHEGKKFPIKWTAPEAAAHKQFSLKSDIWSYGILLFEVVTYGQQPYPGMTQAEALQRVQAGYRMSCPPNCSQQLYDIMLECWSEDPSSRPDFNSLYKQVQGLLTIAVPKPAKRTGSYPVAKPRRGKDKWELDRSEITLIQKHEEGRFGEVWKGHLRGTELVAVKFPKLDRTTITEFLHESQIMKMLQHPYVITLRGVCSKGEPVYIITEFMKHGNLLKYLRGEGRSTAIPQLTVMAVQACGGMSYLEQCNIIHRDLAARNILVGENLICKVADFGLAQKMDSSTYMESTRTQFPLKWMAPEAVATKQFSVKSDVWSFGILLYEIVSHGGLPYPGVMNAEVAEMINAGYRMPCPRNCPKQLHNVMMECWKEKPEDRPCFKTLEQKLMTVQATLK